MKASALSRVSTRSTMIRSLVQASFVIALTLFTAGAARADEPTEDLTELNLEDLLNVEVTSVARRGQKLAETPAAIFVITSEEIRRSGATTIPDLLRRVPGFEVARVNGNVWAVSARGFNGRYANKLLVLIDGRSIYSNVFSGVDWDEQGLMLEDIERIEVIRGPGGTLWGANAVNGVVSIITKRAVDTQGTLLSTSLGSGAAGMDGAARYGARLGQIGHYRVFAKSFDRPGSPLGSGRRADDDWAVTRAGFRADWDTEAGGFTMSADVYDGIAAGKSFFDPIATNSEIRGEHLIGSWTATQSKRSETNLQAFYQDSRRRSFHLDRRARTFDVEFQQNLTLQRQQASWGVSYRSTYDELVSRTQVLAFGTERQSADLFTAFVQDEIQLHPKFFATLGSKIHYQSVSGLDWQPSVRALWLPTPRQRVWAAVTRAVRTPSISELDMTTRPGAFPTGPGTALLTVEGNPDLRSEYVVASELGYRMHPVSSVTVDVTAFHNSAEQLVANYIGPFYVDQNGQARVPILYGNILHGEISGLETFATFRPSGRWDLTVGYSFLHTDLVSDSAKPTAVTISPQHQWQLRSSVTLMPRTALEAAVYYVGTRPGQNLGDDYRLDLRVSSEVGPMELSIAAENLFGGSHLEFNGVIEQPSLAPTSQSLTGRATWRF